MAPSIALFVSHLAYSLDEYNCLEQVELGDFCFLQGLSEQLRGEGCTVLELGGFDEALASHESVEHFLALSDMFYSIQDWGEPEWRIRFS